MYPSHGKEEMQERLGFCSAVAVRWRTGGDLDKQNVCVRVCLCGCVCVRERDNF